MFSAKNRVGKKFFDFPLKPLKVLNEPEFSLKIYEGKDDLFKVGVVVSKKISPKAVRRNFLKRKISSIFERNKQKLEPLTYIVYLKKDIEDLTFVEDKITNFLA